MIKDALGAQLTFVDYSVAKNLEGISQEDSVKSAGGNSINWVLGHIINTRGAMLRLMGGALELSEGFGELYGRHSKPIGEGDPCESIDDLRAVWATSQAALLAGLAALDQERLEAMVPKIFEPEQQEPVGVQLATFLFHECYHAGQLGVIRRNAGLAPAIS